MVKNLGCCWRTDQYSVLNTICPVGQLFPYRQYHIACPTTFTCIRHATADISNKCHFNKSTFKDSLWKRCSFINEFVENKIKQSIFCLFHLLIDNFPSSASRVLLNSSSGGESNQNHKQKTIFFFFVFYLYTAIRVFIYNVPYYNFCISFHNNNNRLCMFRTWKSNNYICGKFICSDLVLFPMQNFFLRRRISS